jgi:import inner membrane translocase subunit TIM17
MIGAIQSMKARGPVTGGGFAVWAGLFSTFDCAFAGLRKKEDAWNSIMSGFVTGGVLSARGMFLKQEFAFDKTCFEL